MASVGISDSASLNVLGWFLVSGLRRNLEQRGRACTLSGVLEVEADGMRACVEFDGASVVVSPAATDPRARVSGSLNDLVAALVHRRWGALWRVRVRGNRLFVLRAMRLLRP